MTRRDARPLDWCAWLGFPAVSAVVGAFVAYGFGLLPVFLIGVAVILGSAGCALAAIARAHRRVDDLLDDPDDERP